MPASDYMTWEEYSAANGQGPLARADWERIYGPKSGRATPASDGSPAGQNTGGTSYAEWERLGSPGGNYYDWQLANQGPDTRGDKPTSKAGGTGAPADPFSEITRQYGIDGDVGKLSANTQGEVQRRRGIIEKNGGFEKLPPDVADLVLRDAASGRVRRARGGSARSAIMGGPDLTDPSYRGGM